MLDSSSISHAHPLQINPHKYKKMIEENTTKFGTELKTTKASWKSQLYIGVFKGFLVKLEFYYDRVSIRNIWFVK